MEDYKNDGFDRQEENRSDYGSESAERRPAYSAEGRKLRPRKKVVASGSYGEGGEQRRSFGGQHRSYGESGEQRSSYSSGEGGQQRRSYGEGGQQHRSYGDRPQRQGYGRNSYSESYGNRYHGEGDEQRRSYSESEQRRSYGEEGQRRSYSSGEGGQRRSYGEQRPSYSGRGYGERRSYGEGGEQRRSYNSGEGGQHRNYGEEGQRRSYGDRPQRQSYGRSSYGNRNSAEGEQRRSYSEDGQQRRSYASGEGGQHRSYDRGPSYDRAGGEGAPRRNSKFGAKPGMKPKAKGSAKRKNVPPQFTETDEAGVNRMISRRPQIDNWNASDYDGAPTPIKEEIRLNKFIANSGVCSRREADTFIQAGVVTVNGEVVTELGTKVNVLNDDVRFNGERLKGEEKVYIVMNKPKGYVTTASDPHAEKTVMDLLKGCSARVYPVGRLDKATTGVLMFTNDGEIAERLTHPSYDKKKIYQVILDRELSQDDYEKILQGIELTDGVVAADELEYIDENDHRRLGIEIHSGKNRVVRRIFETLGYDVRALDRVYFAGLTKKGVSKGEWRYLTEGEVNILKMGAYV